MLLALAPMAAGAFPAPGAIVIQQGTVTTAGSNLPWRLYDDGTLVVDAGVINTNSPSSPWLAHDADIERIIFTGPVTAGSSLRGLFAGLTTVTTIEGLEYFDTRNVTVMWQMFNGASSLVSISGLCCWDTSEVTNMSSMFAFTNSLTNLDLSFWDVSNVTTMSYMFLRTYSLASLDLSSWDTSSVTNMSTMFRFATSLEYLDLSGWDTSNVTTMGNMFRDADNLRRLDLSGWDVSSVTAMNGMFYLASSLSSIGDVSGWDVSSVTNMSWMFDSTNLESIDLSGWDTGSVTNMNGMFRNAQGLRELTLGANFEFVLGGGNPNLPAGPWRNVGNLNTAPLVPGATNVSNLMTYHNANPATATWIRDQLNSISLRPLGPFTFEPEYEGYTTTTPQYHTIQVWNTGTTATGPLTITKSGSYFALSETTIPSIAVGYYATFTIAPILGLSEGTYIATVTVYDTASSIYRPIDVIFTVNPVPVWGWDMAPTSDRTFPPAIVGYGAQTPWPVGITNTGNIPTGAFTVALSGTNAGSFTLNRTSIPNVCPCGLPAIFTVMPNTGLMPGTYTATVTVTDMYGVSEYFDVSFTVTDGPTWDVSLTPGDYTFPAAIVGYTVQPTALTTTVTNAGTEETCPLTIALSGTNAGDFTLSTTSITNLATGGTDTFTVVPNLGLAVGTYTATVTVSGGNGISESFDVSFTVNPVPEFGISLTGNHTFPAATYGYGAQTAHTATVTNIGTHPTGELTVSVSNTDFTLSATTISSIAVDGNDTFTVTPALGLSIGTHTATVTVSGVSGDASAEPFSASFTVSFTVGPIPTWGIYLTGNYTFPDATVGYTVQPPAHTAKVTNIGNQPTGLLTVAISNTDFVLSTTTINSLAVYGTDTFTVTPALGLAVGLHTAVVTVSGGTGANAFYAYFTVSFTVTAPGSGGGWLPPPPTDPTQPTEPPTEPPPAEYELHLAYMFGDTRGNFRPLAAITRAEAAAVLVRTQVLDFGPLPDGISGFDVFADVQAEHWFYGYIALAYDAGLITGDPPSADGTRNFRPSDPITRQEFAAMVARLNGVLQPADDFSYFNDWAEVSDWARPYVYTAFQIGWMVGNDLGEFQPLVNISRAEVATAINRMLGRVDSWAALEGVDLQNLSAAREFPDVLYDAWYFPSVLAATNDYRLARDSDGLVIWMEILGT